MQKRKDFLKTAGLLAAGSLLLPELVRSAATRLAVPAGAAASARVKNIGIQLYTVRQEMLADPVATLRQLAKIGFKELESARSEKGNYYGLSPKEIKKITGDLGMRLRSGHIHVDKDWERSIEEATQTGQQYIISAVLPSQGQTIEHYQESADAFNKLGEECRKSHLSFGYHNHDSEFETVKGRVLYDILLERTNPSLVTMEMDLGWVVAAGHDPFQYFSKYPGRFPLVHVKDLTKIPKVEAGGGQNFGDSLPEMTSVGGGIIDWKLIFKQSDKAGIKHYFVEHDHPQEPFASIKASYDYLAKVTF